MYLFLWRSRQCAVSRHMFLRLGNEVREVDGFWKPRTVMGPFEKKSSIRCLRDLHDPDIRAPIDMSEQECENSIGMLQRTQHEFKKMNQLQPRVQGARQREGETTVREQMAEKQSVCTAQ